MILGLNGGAEGKAAAIGQRHIQQGQVEPAALQKPEGLRLAEAAVTAKPSASKNQTGR
ncbi:MAG: hypothetical protein ACLTL5_06015 [Oscillospiraceae bacterium]